MAQVVGGGWITFFKADVSHFAWELMEEKPFILNHFVSPLL